MSEPNNIKSFNEIVACVFNDLYASFPRRISLFPPKYLGVELDKGKLCDDDGYYTAKKIGEDEDVKVGWEELRFVEHSILWLIETGYVSVKDQLKHYYFTEAVLTAKGLELLKLVPSSVDGDKSVGEKIKDAIGGGMKDVASSVVSAALTQGFSLLAG